MQCAALQLVQWRQAYASVHAADALIRFGLQEQHRAELCSEQTTAKAQCLAPASSAGSKAGSQHLTPNKALLAASPGLAMPECAAGTVKPTGSAVSLFLPGPEDQIQLVSQR